MRLRDASLPLPIKIAADFDQCCCYNFATINTKSASRPANMRCGPFMCRRTVSIVAAAFHCTRNYLLCAEEEKRTKNCIASFRHNVNRSIHMYFLCYLVFFFYLLFVDLLLLLFLIRCDVRALLFDNRTINCRWKSQQCPTNVREVWKNTGGKKKDRKTHKKIGLPDYN